MIKIFEYGAVPNSEIFFRGTASADVSAPVSEIIADVRKRGDTAVLEYCRKFDGVDLKAFEVTAEEIDEAVSLVEDEFIRIMNLAASNIREFHSRQVREGFSIERKNGAVMGQKVIPLEKVGIYVPGGTAAYPSSVLMNCIPAKLAGCGEVVMATPPGKDGKINPNILVAAKVAGVDRIFKMGGAQAVAALAYGTESVPKVDKITGPGNAFVAEAKKQVFGAVAIDMIAGPSEILVVADGKSNPRIVAADMLSQAEHDKMASAVLVTDSMELAKAVQAELERQIPLLPRAGIAGTSIENNGKIIVAGDIKLAIDIANEIAPEHLELCCDNAMEMLKLVKNAGSVFVGRNCPEALGDYLAGPNHVLPTGGTARFSSPLSVDDFVKKMQFTYYTEDALSEVAEDIAYFADKEGLHGHAKSAVSRFSSEDE
ncbi:MAG: histidinol dehydrogenase [Clostridia bacterium]|nr:histidinol dehydrogenase [Clostridia bacterium]